MWLFRIVCLRLVFWPFGLPRLCSEAAGKAAVFSRLAADWLSYGRLEDLMRNVVYVENLK